MSVGQVCTILAIDTSELTPAQGIYIKKPIILFSMLKLCALHRTLILQFKEVQLKRLRQWLERDPPKPYCYAPNIGVNL